MSAIPYLTPPLLWNNVCLPVPPLWTPQTHHSISITVWSQITNAPLTALLSVPLRVPAAATDTTRRRRRHGPPSTSTMTAVGSDDRRRRRRRARRSRSSWVPVSRRGAAPYAAGDWARSPHKNEAELVMSIGWVKRSGSRGTSKSSAVRGNVAVQYTTVWWGVEIVTSTHKPNSCQCSTVEVDTRHCFYWRVFSAYLHKIVLICSVARWNGTEHVGCWKQWHVGFLTVPSDPWPASLFTHIKVRLSGIASRSS